LLRSVQESLILHIIFAKLKLTVYGTMLLILFYWCVTCSPLDNKIGLKAKKKKCCFLSFEEEKLFLFTEISGKAVKRVFGSGA